MIAIQTLEGMRSGSSANAVKSVVGWIFLKQEEKNGVYVWLKI